MFMTMWPQYSDTIKVKQFEDHDRDRGHGPFMLYTAFSHECDKYCYFIDVLCYMQHR